MTNKYLTKIASLFYPEVPKHEFDMAFEGEANPNLERIRAAVRARDKERYHSDLDDWRRDAHWVATHRPEAVSSHMADMPAPHDYDTLGDISSEHRDLAHHAGRAVPGPSKAGLGIGYGLGALGVGAGLATKNLGLGALGLGAAGVTGLYHHFAQPEKRYNRFLSRIEELNEQKQELLNRSADDGITYA